MSTISKLKAKLGEHPHVRFVDEGNTLRIPPVDPEGFEVELYERGGAVTVFFAGWHEECVARTMRSTSSEWASPTRFG